MKLHDFDALSFIAGAVATGIGLAFLVLPEPSDIIEAFTNAGAWVWPLLFIAVGVAVLAPLAWRGRRSDEDSEESQPS